MCTLRDSWDRRVPKISYLSQEEQAASSPEIENYHKDEIERYFNCSLFSVAGVWVGNVSGGSWGKWEIVEVTSFNAKMDLAKFGV